MLWRLQNIFTPHDVRQKLQQLVELQAQEYVTRTILLDPKYKDERHLLRFQSRSFSQHGEDGIIAEIFKRIGTTNRVCVEFGCGNGLENNSMLLLVQQWKTIWIESEKNNVEQALDTFYQQIKNGTLSVHHALLTKENICPLFQEFKIPKEFDFLSIDVDGNDYWLWKKIEEYRPRVIAIEYNPLFPPPIAYISTYTDQVWDGSSYFGASISSLCHLANHKGYKLVACDFSGTNAFFVREDEIQDRFIYTENADFLYEPQRYFLTYPSGHPRGFGKFEVNSKEDISIQETNI